MRDVLYSDPKDVGSGKIKTTNNKTEFTIILIGEIQSGKTSLLSFIANVLAGRKHKDYSDMYAQHNEMGGISKSQSQTMRPTAYEFRSNNGIVVRILDTPGLSSSSESQQDKMHIAGVVQAIRNHISTIDAVFLVVDGIAPPTAITTDNLLCSALLSLLPLNIADNVALVFTHISTPQSLTFKEGVLPSILRKSKRFMLDNPAETLKKYNEQGGMNGQEPGNTQALDTVAKLFDWLDQCISQPAKDILTLHDRSQKIEGNVTNAVARMRTIQEKTHSLKNIKKDLEKANLVSILYCPYFGSEFFDIVGRPNVQEYGGVFRCGQCRQREVWPSASASRQARSAKDDRVVRY